MTAQNERVLRPRGGARVGRPYGERAPEDSPLDLPGAPDQRVFRPKAQSAAKPKKRARSRSRSKSTSKKQRRSASKNEKKRGKSKDKKKQDETKKKQRQAPSKEHKEMKKRARSTSKEKEDKSKKQRRSTSKEKKRSKSKEKEKKRDTVSARKQEGTAEEVDDAPVRDRAIVMGVDHLPYESRVFFRRQELSDVWDDIQRYIQPKGAQYHPQGSSEYEWFYLQEWRYEAKADALVRWRRQTEFDEKKREWKFEELPVKKQTRLERWSQSRSSMSQWFTIVPKTTMVVKWFEHALPAKPRDIEFRHDDTFFHPRVYVALELPDALTLPAHVRGANQLRALLRVARMWRWTYTPAECWLLIHVGMLVFEHRVRRTNSEFRLARLPRQESSELPALPMVPVPPSGQPLENAAGVDVPMLFGATICSRSLDNVLNTTLTMTEQVVQYQHQRAKERKQTSAFDTHDVFDFLLETGHDFMVKHHALSREEEEEESARQLEAAAEQLGDKTRFKFWINTDPEYPFFRVPNDQFPPDWDEKESATLTHEQVLKSFPLAQVHESTKGTPFLMNTDVTFMNRFQLSIQRRMRKLLTVLHAFYRVPDTHLAYDDPVFHVREGADATQTALDQHLQDTTRKDLWSRFHLNVNSINQPMPVPDKATLDAVPPHVWRLWAERRRALEGLGSRKYLLLTMTRDNRYQLLSAKESVRSGALTRTNDTESRTEADAYSWFVPCLDWTTPSLPKKLATSTDTPSAQLSSPWLTREHRTKWFGTHGVGIAKNLLDGERVEDKKKLGRKAKPDKPPKIPPPLPVKPAPKPKPKPQPPRMSESKLKKLTQVLVPTPEQQINRLNLIAAEVESRVQLRYDRGTRLIHNIAGHGLATGSWLGPLLFDATLDADVHRNILDQVILHLSINDKKQVFDELQLVKANGWQSATAAKALQAMLIAGPEDEHWAHLVPDFRGVIARPNVEIWSYTYTEDKREYLSLQLRATEPIMEQDVLAVDRQLVFESLDNPFWSDLLSTDVLVDADYDMPSLQQVMQWVHAWFVHEDKTTPTVRQMQSDGFPRDSARARWENEVLQPLVDGTLVLPLDGGKLLEEFVQELSNRNFEARLITITRRKKQSAPRIRAGTVQKIALPKEKAALKTVKDWKKVVLVLNHGLRKSAKTFYLPPVPEPAAGSEFGENIFTLKPMYPVEPEPARDEKRPFFPPPIDEKKGGGLDLNRLPGQSQWPALQDRLLGKLKAIKSQLQVPIFSAVDVDALSPKQWLTDPLIDSYMRILQRQFPEIALLSASQVSSIVDFNEEVEPQGKPFVDSEPRKDETEEEYEDREDERYARWYRSKAGKAYLEYERQKKLFAKKFKARLESHPEISLAHWTDNVEPLFDSLPRKWEHLLLPFNQDGNHWLLVHVQRNSKVVHIFDSLLGVKPWTLTNLEAVNIFPEQWNPNLRKLLQFIHAYFQTNDQQYVFTAQQSDSRSCGLFTLQSAYWLATHNFQLPDAIALDEMERNPAMQIGQVNDPDGAARIALANIILESLK